MERYQDKKQPRCKCHPYHQICHHQVKKFQRDHKFNINKIKKMKKNEKNKFIEDEKEIDVIELTCMPQKGFSLHLVSTQESLHLSGTHWTRHKEAFHLIEARKGKHLSKHWRKRKRRKGNPLGEVILEYHIKDQEKSIK